MIIKIASQKIPEYWDIIKYALSQVLSYSPERRQDVLNKHLLELLSETEQCWLLINAEGHIKTLAVTKLTNTYQTVEIHILCIYGFETTSTIEREEWWNTLDKWAENINAKRILTSITHPRYGEALEDQGFRVRETVYMKERS